MDDLADETNDIDADAMASAGEPDGERIEVSAAAGAGERLDRFLASQLSGYSRSRIQRWIALGAVTCAQRVLANKTRLNGTEQLIVEPQPLEADSAFVAQEVAFEVIAEQTGFLVVNKPVGLVVHPGAGNWQGTLMNGLLFRFPALAALPRAGIVHRLDKDTSGLLVVARVEAAREALIGQLATRTLSRRYLAICQGHVAQALVMDGAIGRDAGNRLRMAVRGDGKSAYTEAEPLAHGTLGDRPVTLMHCRLRTGRTHQIRVHLAHAGFPLAGDVVYGGSAQHAPRQMLHAWHLALAEPVLGESGAYRHGPPEDFLAVLSAAGINAEAIPVAD